MADTEQDLGNQGTPTDTESSAEETEFPTIEPRQEDEDITHHRPEHEPVDENS